MYDKTVEMLHIQDLWGWPSDCSLLGGNLCLMSNAINYEARDNDVWGPRDRLRVGHVGNQGNFIPGDRVQVAKGTFRATEHFMQPSARRSGIGGRNRLSDACCEVCFHAPVVVEFPHFRLC